MNDQATPSDPADDEPSPTQAGTPASSAGIDNAPQSAQPLPDDDDPGLDEAMSDVAVVDSVTAEHPGDQ
ncbi:hypothetical protein SJI00_13445 [Pseudomonas sp. RP23018S]|uniref:hypothetical protein n=1 Tax=Pseudomonas sp. RP23018S TaxID=3096037 RepID=UPI002ACAAFE6|nr:hypothetical protein [Pseudomonas sp. RP23018S]MDZ5603782.1 hypothetical protein [Pseudomonas sp. RP23018S]